MGLNVQAVENAAKLLDKAKAIEEAWQDVVRNRVEPVLEDKADRKVNLYTRIGYDFGRDLKDRMMAAMRDHFVKELDDINTALSQLGVEPYRFVIEAPNLSRCEP